MTEIYRWRDIEKGRFELRVQEPVRINKVRAPCPHILKRTSHPQERHVPRRNTFRQKDPFPSMRDIDLIRKRQLMISPLQCGYEIRQVVFYTADLTAAPIHNQQSHYNVP